MANTKLQGNARGIVHRGTIKALVRSDGGLTLKIDSVAISLTSSQRTGLLECLRRTERRTAGTPIAISTFEL